MLVEPTLRQTRRVARTKGMRFAPPMTGCGGFMLYEPSSAAWTPASLSNKVAWYRADLGTNTTTNGANVTSWADQYGRQAAFSNALAIPPTYVSSAINSKPAINSTGSSATQMTSTSSTSWGLTSGFSVCIVQKFTGHGTNDMYIAKGATAGTQWGAADNSGVSSPKNIVSWTSSVTKTSPLTSTALADGSWFCMHNSLTSGGTMAWTVNGSSLSSTTGVSMPTSGANAVSIFSTSDLICLLNGQIAEIIVTSAPITGSDATSLSSYITARYGSPLAFA